MSALPLTVKRTFITCSNPSCERYGRPSEKASLKCANCKSARYCDKDCQRQHWRQHKEFCKIWASSSANNDQITVAQIKLKMAYLIWLLRGVPDYVAYLFAEYDYWRKRDKRGFIEFEFDNWQRLFNAIRFIEELPVYKDEPFVAMPGTPSYAPPGAKQLTLPMRKISREVFDRFNGVVEDYMHFTENQNRPNLQRALDVAMQCGDLFVISVTVSLDGPYSTHTYDFIYRSVSWKPSDNGPLTAIPTD
ncbi:hypothetical protein EDB89DRAFT_785075 [Lactarius sanguifluus]|nr:hypothetical protein EDB89DRAFT_785075 [Lactarius sanguifluus]